MEDSKRENATSLKEYRLDKYLFVYPANLEYEKYSCKDYSGIIFETEDCRYDVCNNYLLGWRLIINPKAGGFKDIPFKPATFGFLPIEITVREIR